MKGEKIVIIGGGFGGLKLARELRDADAHITLVDRQNHHLFQPLLYQVASAALSPRDIGYPIREILKRQENTTVLLDEAEKIDPEKKKVYLSSGKVLEYDKLVLAVGASHSYFGHDEWEVHAPGLKTLRDAIAIREKILTSFEKAENTQEPSERGRLLTFVIVGGGPTGVELAGAIAEIAHKTMLKNFRHIDPTHSKIYLIEGAAHILGMYPEELSLHAKRDLEQIGVTVLVNSVVKQISESGVQIGDTLIESRNIFWAAGNKASPLLSTLEIPLDRQGRALVRPDLSVEKYPDLYVIGDAAHCEDEKGAVLPGIAPVAIQQGKFLAKRLMGKKGAPASFSYRDKGFMATIGKAKAVACIGSYRFSGLFAWLLWGFIHIAFLIGFRNRLVVMFEWFFWYCVGERGSRLIIDKYKG